MLSNTRGGVTLLLASLPLLIAVIMTVLSSAILTNEWLRLHSLCRQRLLEIQTTQAKTIETLTAMNPLAQSLRREYQLAKEAVKNAPGPARVAAAAYLASVIAKQVSFRTNQLIIINKNKTQVLQQTLKLKRDFQTPHKISRPQLALETYPKTSLSPDYRTVPLFSEAQQMSAQFVLQVHNLLPTFLTRNYKFNFLGQIDGQCGSTIKKRGQKWLPILKKGKSLLKPQFQLAF